MTTLVVSLTTPLYGQHLLNKKISITLSPQTLGKALTAIGHKEGFYFSYNSDMIPGDSIVHVSVREKTLKEVLRSLLGSGYAYGETGNYIIIRPKAADRGMYVISGQVIDKATGDKVPNASVYESNQFISTLTDAQGYFHLRLHDRSPRSILTISRVHFNDTTFMLQPGYDQALTVYISPIRSIRLKPVTVTPTSRIEGMWLGKLFISSKQKIQDINLSRFFVRQPFQYSIVPGIGTHGKLSAQVVNKFSMNILGGYTAGVNGFELGGLFNIDKKGVRYAQVAGLFNTVGGNVKGVQVAGLYNGVMDSVQGFQVAGIHNKVKGSFTGVQIAGLSNHVAGNLSGLMLAGITNRAPQNVNGIQISGILNRAHRIDGLQLAGIWNSSETTVQGAQLALINRTRNLKGWQLGLLNISDTSSGYHIGLVNIVRHGFHRLSFGWNESFDMNIAYKSGNKKLYTVLLASVRVGENRKAFALGYGLGNESTFSPRLSLVTELSERVIYNGQWNDLPMLSRLQTAAQVRLTDKISLFAGPSFSVFFPPAQAPPKGYGSISPSNHYFSLGDRLKGWLGGGTGITFF